MVANRPRPGQDPLEALLGPGGPPPGGGPGMSPPMVDPDPPMPGGPGGPVPPIPGVRPGAEAEFIELLGRLASLMVPQNGGPPQQPGMPTPGGRPPGGGPPNGGPGGPPGGGPSLMDLLGGGSGGGRPRPPRR